MRTALILLLFLSNLCVNGQSVLLKNGSCKGESYSYALRNTDSTKTHLIVGLLDSTNKTWNSVSWCSMIDRITDQRGAVLIVPERSTDLNVITCLIESYRDSITDGQFQFVGLGSGSQLASNLINQNFSGLFISPQLTPIQVNSNGESAFAICKTNDNNTVGFLVDSLSRDSHWVREWSLPSQDIFYIDNFKHEYHQMYKWVDSVQSSLLDTSSAELSSSISLNLPEVIRQGTEINVDVFLVEQGEVKCSIQSLSAEDVLSQQLYLGKGKHTVSLSTSRVEWGVYTLIVEYGDSIEKRKFMIRG